MLFRSHRYLYRINTSQQRQDLYDKTTHHFLYFYRCRNYNEQVLPHIVLTYDCTIQHTCNIQPAHFSWIQLDFFSVPLWLQRWNHITLVCILALLNNIYLSLKKQQRNLKIKLKKTYPDPLCKQLKIIKKLLKYYFLLNVHLLPMNSIYPFLSLYY